MASPPIACARHALDAALTFSSCSRAMRLAAARKSQLAGSSCRAWWRNRCRSSLAWASVLKCAAAAVAVGIKSRQAGTKRKIREQDNEAGRWRRRRWQREWEQERRRENENKASMEDEPLNKVEASALAHCQLHLNKKQQTQKNTKKKQILRNLRKLFT